MKKNIIMMTAILLLISISTVLGEASFYQYKASHGNGTIVQNYLVLEYNKNKAFGFAEDYITGNNPYIVYLRYDFYLKSYNEDAPNDKVINCSWIVRRLTDGDPIILVNMTYTANDEDIKGAKYFIQLKDGEGLTASQTCYFENASTSLDLPADMQVVAPTWECKACQQSKWEITERKITKVKTIEDNTTAIIDYIQRLFFINFEIWLALFWIFLILMIFVSISMIFWGIYFVFLYLRRLAK